MLQLKSISKKYSTEIFKDFSFNFQNNTIYHLSGSNGSGKSTLLRLIKGIYICDKGEIRFECKLDQKNDVSLIDANLRTFFYRITARQNLDYFFSLQNKNGSNNTINELLKFFEVENLQHKKFSSLSQGQMQTMSIIRGLASSPKIILLDEVFSCLDKSHKSFILSYLSEFILKEKALVIFTSHDEDFNKLNYKELCLDQ